ncbi:uncharacterized protein [Leptinotarsa decemlineata]|uniref:uncharacterized protein n=1 Tax=Leptinotarsa decemlineata TaxID=7539 RepID=UPI003D307650
MDMTLTFLIFLVVGIASASVESPCFDASHECHSTDYQSYVDCVRGRHKRSTDCSISCDSGNCSDTCNECDCESCNYSNCQSGCNTCCNSCCSNYVSCRTNHCCHKTCHAQCESSSCRSKCRRNCFDNVSRKNEESYSRETVIEKGGAGPVDLKNENKHNITTIIHLNNVINNTNVVDIPIVLNNTNTQNITLYNQESSPISGDPSQVEKCCTVIGPRQCVQTPKPRCFHYRSKQCGEFCTASIVHKEQQQICEVNYPGAPPNCRQQVIYIPQPQPKCVYQSVWPYVACGIQKSETCGGCYSHYVDQSSTAYATCPSQCYDQGYGLGPMYRQGPFYQMTYSHMPCYQCLGLQPPYGLEMTGFGSYAGAPAYGGVPGFVGVPAYGGISSQSGFPVYSQGPQLQYPFDPKANASVQPLSSDGQIINPEFVLEQIPIPINQTPQLDNIRDQREIEIEVNYEPPSDAQAEVKIKKNDIEKEVTKNETLEVSNVEINKTLS